MHNGYNDTSGPAKQETLLERVSRIEGTTMEALAKQGAEIQQLYRRVEFLERILGDRHDNYPQAAEAPPPPYNSIISGSR